MNERIKVAEPCDRFPYGVYTGDRVMVRGGPGTVRAKICTADEWASDRSSKWPPDRVEFKLDGRLPYMTDSCPRYDRFKCWRASPDRITIIRPVMEESGQLLMF